MKAPSDTPTRVLYYRFESSSTLQMASKSSQDGHSKKKFSKSKEIGVGVGSTLAIILVCAIVFFIWYKRRLRKGQIQANKAPIDSMPEQVLTPRTIATLQASQLGGYHSHLPTPTKAGAYNFTGSYHHRYPSKYFEAEQASTPKWQNIPENLAQCAPSTNIDIASPPAIHFNNSINGTCTYAGDHR